MLNAEDLAYWDVDAKKFLIETGKIECMIGKSSEEILFSNQIEVTEK